MEKKTEVIIALAKAYEQKNTQITDRVEAIIIPQDLKLNEVLKEKLKEIKNNPIEESELYKQIKELNVFAFNVELCRKLQIDIDAFDSLEIMEFKNAVVNKITDFIDEDGMYKTTSALSGMKLPRASQMNILYDVAVENESKDNEIFADKLDEFTGINRKEISMWELELYSTITSQFMSAQKDAAQLRQAIDKTPFARYLKN